MKKLMLGNEAIARGAYEAGVTVVSSYPGTPSTEITEYAAKYDEIYAEWAINEKVGLEVAYGASFGGTRAMSAMKHVGLNVAADPLFTASYTGVNGGLVICVADDQGMHSSQNEQDSRYYAKFSKVPMLEPSDSGECLKFTKYAFELSEQYDTPVLVRLSTRVAHSQSLVETGERIEKEIPPYEKNMQKYVMVPANAKLRHIEVEKRTVKLQELAEKSSLNNITYNDKKIGIIAGGIAYEYAREALKDKASYLKLGMVYPLPDELIKEFAKNVETLYVIEELDPIIENHCKALGIKVIGKEKFSLLFEYSSNEIKKVILGEETQTIELKETIPNRPPVMCAGCTHRGTFYAMRQLGLVICGDIGCYTLSALPPLSTMDSVLCMGASVSMAYGMELARGKEYAKKVVAVLGDSTFMHSGITALLNIAYNGGISTVVILDNSITGMTGHQQNPVSGYTLKGKKVATIDFEKLCQSIGIERVTTVDAFDYDKMKDTIKEETEADEISVVIVKRPCALIPSFKSHGKRKINNEKCTGCGVCLKIGCPSISKFGKVAEIDRNLCVGCTYCQVVCKFNAIEKEEA